MPPAVPPTSHTRTRMAHHRQVCLRGPTPHRAAGRTPPPSVGPWVHASARSTVLHAQPPERCRMRARARTPDVPPGHVVRRCSARNPDVPPGHVERRCSARNSGDLAASPSLLTSTQSP
eukprot:320380-Chlamydomonas_euryale.AAC.1